MSKLENCFHSKLYKIKTNRIKDPNLKVYRFKMYNFLKIYYSFLNQISTF